MTIKQWDQLTAIRLCNKVEEIAPAFDYHVALTGGCLYKLGDRKDCDLMLYRVRQAAGDKAGLLKHLAKTGFSDFQERSEWLTKCKYRGAPVDLLFPDSQSGIYETSEEAL